MQGEYSDQEIVAALEDSVGTSALQVQEKEEEAQEYLDEVKEALGIPEQPAEEEAEPEDNEKYDEINFEDLMAETEKLDMKDAPVKADPHADFVEKLKSIKPEDKVAFNAKGLVDDNLLKVAKRSRTWLSALNEEAALARREKSVERSYVLAGQFMNKNYLRSIK